MKPMSLTSPEAIANEYGGNKQKIRDATAMGLLNPTAALLAGMFIDRMRNAAMEEKKPDTTLAQDVFGVQSSGIGTMAGNQLGMQGQQLGPTAPPQPSQPQPTQMAQAPVGIEALPAGDVGNYAGGGIVAFDDGGYVPKYAGFTDGSLVRSITDADAIALGYPNAQAYNRSMLAKKLQDTFGAQGRPNSPVFVNQPTAPVANTNAYGIQRPDPKANLALATQQAGELITVPETLTQQKAIENKEALNRAMGVNENIYQEQKATLGQDREQLKADREEAKWARVFEAGIAAMAGESPYAAVNIGKGAGPALKGYVDDIKELKKTDRELSRAQMALDKAENDYKLDKSKSVETQLEKSQERVDKAQTARAGAASQLSASLNTLGGSVFSAETGAAASKENALVAERSAANTAQKHYDATLAQVAASKYASDIKERQIQKIMADRGIGYMDAITLLGEAEHPKDRFNAIHNAITAFNTSVQNDLKILGLDAKRSELMKDPKKNADAIAALDAKEKEIRDVRRREYGLTQADYDYVQQESQRLAGKNKPSQQQQQPAAPTTQALPMPQKQSELQKGSVYNTSRGPARWNGTAFEPVQ